MRNKFWRISDKLNFCACCFLKYGQLYFSKSPNSISACISRPERPKGRKRRLLVPHICHGYHGWFPWRKNLSCGEMFPHDRFSTWEIWRKYVIWRNNNLICLLFDTGSHFPRIGALGAIFKAVLLAADMTKAIQTKCNTYSGVLEWFYMLMSSSFQWCIMCWA